MGFAKLLASNRVFSCITVSVDRDRQRQWARRKSLPRPGNPVGGLMKRFRMAALAVAMTLAFSGLALARDHDDDDHNRRDRHHDRDREIGRASCRERVEVS